MAEGPGELCTEEDLEGTEEDLEGTEEHLVGTEEHLEEPSIAAS